MKKTIGFVYAVAFATLSACGHSDATSAQTSPATTDTSAYIGGVCGDQVVEDHRHLTDECEMNDGRGRGRIEDSCRSAAQDFLNRYPAVSCSLSERDGRGEARERRIEAREIQELADGDRR